MGGVSGDKRGEGRVEGSCSYGEGEDRGERARVRARVRRGRIGLGVRVGAGVRVRQWTASGLLGTAPPRLGRDDCLYLRSVQLRLSHLPAHVARYKELPSVRPTDSEGVHLPCQDQGSGLACTTCHVRLRLSARQLPRLATPPGDPRVTMPALAAPAWFELSRHRPSTDPRVYRELGADLWYRVDRTLAIELDRARARLSGGGRWGGGYHAYVCWRQHAHGW